MFNPNMLAQESVQYKQQERQQAVLHAALQSLLRLFGSLDGSICFYTASYQGLSEPRPIFQAI